jgi:hypothetical protein
MAGSRGEGRQEAVDLAAIWRSEAGAVVTGERIVISLHTSLYDYGRGSRCSCLTRTAGWQLLTRFFGGGLFRARRLVFQCEGTCRCTSSTRRGTATWRR